MCPKPNVSELRTRQIIEAAIAVFAKKGFAQTRMEDIATVAGLSKGTIYLYFENKDALINVILETIFSQELADLQTASDMPGSVIEKLAAFLEMFIAEGESLKPLMPLVYDFYAMSIRRADVRQVLSRHLHAFVNVVEAIIQQGIERGELRPVDAQKAALIFMALLESVVLQDTYSSEMVDVDVNEQLRFGAELLLKGLQQ